MVPDVKFVDVPKPYGVPQPYIVRQTVRENAEVKTTKAEEVKTKQVEKEKEATIPPILQYSGLMLAIAVLIIAITLLIRLFKK
ncbi:hypothetical protein [Dyadobacter helix]|nr:hypothetical protein [Dyadobacter sp. CECT 9275]